MFDSLTRRPCLGSTPDRGAWPWRRATQPWRPRWLRPAAAC